MTPQEIKELHELDDKFLEDKKTDAGGRTIEEWERFWMLLLKEYEDIRDGLRAYPGAK